MGGSQSSSLILANVATVSNAPCRTAADCASKECCVHNLCTSAPEVCPKARAHIAAKFPCKSFAKVGANGAVAAACQAHCGQDAQCIFACRTCKGENMSVPANWDWLSHSRNQRGNESVAAYYSSWATMPASVTAASDSSLPWTTVRVPRGGVDVLF